MSLLKLGYMDELSPECERRRNIKEEKKIVGEEEKSSKTTGLRRRHGY
ncbi:unnamed protein product [Brassica oleracea var. botrytis]